MVRGDNESIGAIDDACGGEASTTLDAYDVLVGSGDEFSDV
jgi:hypothetical protein